MPNVQNYDLSPDTLQALVAAIRENLMNPPEPWSDRWFYHDGSCIELVALFNGRIFLWKEEGVGTGEVIAACRFRA